MLGVTQHIGFMTRFTPLSCGGWFDHFGPGKTSIFGNDLTWDGSKYYGNTATWGGAYPLGGMVDAYPTLNIVAGSTTYNVSGVRFTLNITMTVGSGDYIFDNAGARLAFSGWDGSSSGTFTPTVSFSSRNLSAGLDEAIAFDFASAAGRFSLFEITNVQLYFVCP